MKNSQPQVSIAEPCSEDWNKMENRDGQNYCKTCSKCVIDFTGYSNADILKTLANSSAEVCGRLTENQLAQLNYHLIVAPAGKTWMKYLGVLAIGGSIFFQNAYAAMPISKIENTKNIETKREGGNKPDSVKKVSGYIFNVDKKPLAGIRLVILNTKYYATTDKNGKYEFIFNKGLDIKNNTLIIQSAQYSASIKVDFSKEKQESMIAVSERIIVGKIIYAPNEGNKFL